VATSGIPSSRFWLPLSIGVLAVFSGLLLLRLGHYPFWCDEADTALYARGVARTGDTYAVLGHNIYAFRDGACLVNLRERYEPPAPFYFAAPFVGRDGTGAFWPRFPFAVCGLLSVAFILYWLQRDKATPLLSVLVSLGLLLNVSLVLYFRQCRYYGLAALLSILMAYCYVHWGGRRRMLVGFSALGILLLLTHYLAYAGLMLGVAIDYAIFARRERRLTLRDWAVVLMPQIIASVIVILIWNPLDKNVVEAVPDQPWLTDRLILLWRNLRDVNACEYGVGLLLLAAPLLYFIDRNPWLLRGAVAIVSYAVAVSLFSPQPVALTMGADIRYLSALIPLCIFVGCLAIRTLSGGKWWIAIPLALVAFGTNVLNQPWSPADWRSTSWQWVAELLTARATATQRTIDWINDNVQSGQSILVQPDALRYPLMYHAPQAVYAWQLMPPPQGQFKDLPPIHFAGLEPPDFIIEFGRRDEVRQVIDAYQKQVQITYTQVGAINVQWDDQIRPEIFGRRFEPVVDFDPAQEGVYIWRRME
jgi:hypothetical protein